jgi:uncharacterized protein YbaR (Trm112 family)
MATPRRSLPLDLLCCPRCRGPLDPAAAIACAACGIDFPEVDGLPWLFAEPAAALGEWRARAHGYLAGLDLQATHYRAALTDEVTRASTRNRLKLLAGACTDHARRLRALLAPLGIGADAAAPELYSALGMTLPAGQGLAGYYANLHRDWCWGEEENESAFRIVDEVLGPGAPGRTLLLGVGAGRLAYDLLCRRRPDLLVMADVNPLYLMAARRLFAGEPLELYEFPLAPRDLESHAVLHRLEAPAPAPDGWHMVYADAAQSPFAAGAWDTVVTPWLIDVLDEDLASFARRVNRCLRPGGRWVNTGSLSFAADDPARRYALEEVLEIVASAGFDPVVPREEALRYLCSPASRHGRVESVVTFVATRRTDVAEPPPPARQPSWLVRADLPVPLSAGLERRQLELRVLSYVASLVDGRRSVHEVARVLVEQRLLAPAEAEPMVRAFLARLHEESRMAAMPPS